MSHSHHRQSSSSSSSSHPMTITTISAPSMVTLESSSSPYTNAHYRCEELRKRIHENHLSYLNREETPEKLDTRTKMECLIAEYLSLVPHDRKFSFTEVANCLNRSISENPEFSAYKAAGAFEALEKYATNLLSHPWRKEYHTICPYGGFYRHVIQKMLIAAEPIICLMGFEYFPGKGSFQLIDSPIDPDKVSRVSLECLVAFVECQIMIQIRDSVKSKGYDCNWREILTIRSEYVCGHSEVVKLICEKRKTAKLIDYDNSGSLMNTKKSIQNIGHSQWQNNGYNLIDDKYTSSKHLSQEKCPPIDFIYNDDDAIESFDLLNYPILNHNSFPIPSPCHYCMPHSGSLPSPSHAIPYITPTLFAPFPPVHSQMHVPQKVQTANKGIQAEVRTDPSTIIETALSKLNMNSTKRHATDTSTSGHSNSPQLRKDQTSNLNKNSTVKSEKRGSFYDNLEPLISLDSLVSDGKSFELIDKKQNEKKSPVIEKHKQNTTLEKKKTSSLDKKKGLDISKIVNSIKPQTNPTKNGTLLTVNTSDNKAQNTQQSVVPSPSPNSMGTSNKLSKPQDVFVNNEVKHVSDHRWPCLSCTYLNGTSRDICEICHRSRKSGHESTPLISGGRECPRCTLVNGKDEKFCTACDTSLADSPTYI